MTRTDPVPEPYTWAAAPAQLSEVRDVTPERIAEVARAMAATAQAMRELGRVFVETLTPAFANLAAWVRSPEGRRLIRAAEKLRRRDRYNARMRARALAERRRG